MRINFDEHHALSALGALSGALVLSLAVAALCLLRNKFRPGLCSIPGPALAAYSALWRWYDVSKGNAQWTAIQLHRKHGPLVRIGPNHISVGDPREIKNIYGLKSGYTKVRRIYKHSQRMLRALTNRSVASVRVLPYPVGHLEGENPDESFQHPGRSLSSPNEEADCQ